MRVTTRSESLWDNNTSTKAGLYRIYFQGYSITQNMYNRKCKKCNTEFETRKKDQQCCSKRCANSLSSANRITIDESAFNENIDTSDKAYLLGYIFSDGCLSYDKHSKRERITIVSNDLQIIKEFHKIMTPQKSIYQQGKSYKIVSNNFNDIRLLKEYGVSYNKSLTIEFPLIENALLPDFIRGIFDGDGCVYINKTRSNNIFYEYLNVSFTTGSLRFANGLIDALALFNIKARLNKDCRKNIYYVKIQSKSNIKRFFDLIYCNNSLRLERKYNTFVKVI